MDKEIDVVVPSLYGMFNAEQDKLKTVILQAVAAFESVTGACIGEVSYKGGLFNPLYEGAKDLLQITYKIK
jgi:hypothetical protein